MRPTRCRAALLLFTIHTGAGVFRIAVRSASGEQRTLLDNGFFARYVKSGHIVFGRADGLFAVPFDLSSLQLTGPPVLVAEKVLTSNTDGAIAFSTAADGTLAYVPSVDRSSRSLFWVDRGGRAEPFPMPRARVRLIPRCPRTGRDWPSRSRTVREAVSGCTSSPPARSRGCLWGTTIQTGLGGWTEGICRMPRGDKRNRIFSGSRSLAAPSRSRWSRAGTTSGPPRGLPTANV